MSKHKFTLMIEKELVQKIKIRALQDGRTVSDITAELYREYLKRSKSKN